MLMFRCGLGVRKELGVRAEIKNLNSFRALEKAIEYEAARHMDLP
jgi:aspartyl-tRNA(Asn)/glutamyl-tRNA(Gln) amidotransferase subunit B